MRVNVSGRAWPILATVLSAVMLAAGATPAAGRPGGNPTAEYFQRIASFPVYLNTDINEETVAEIVAVTDDGNTLVYTDGEQEGIGFIDITDPANPKPDGFIEMSGEPTSIDVAGDYVLAAIEDGTVAVISQASRIIVRSIVIGDPAQLDAIAVSPDGRYAAVAVENERDEDLIVEGVKGGLPQPPPGWLAIIDLYGTPIDWTVRTVDFTGLADYAPSDPEPEFVDVNEGNFAVVTLQENNHLVVVHLPTGRIHSHFNAGTVDLDGVDTLEEDTIALTDTLVDVPREPDAVAWVGGSRFATANEGDLFGGSRGFSIFDSQGGVRYDSGTSFEELAVRHGHYPDDRSANKGSEPEGIASARFGPYQYLFVGSERGSFIGVYRLWGGAEPEFVQLLPAGLGPEGILPIPERDLLVVSSEVDDEPFGIRSTVTIYQLRDEPTYPDLVSANDVDGKPIGWAAMSGVVADPSDPDTVYAVWDSFYAESRIFTIDVSMEPAVITDYHVVVPGSFSGDYDPEGIAIDSDGDFWIASEGKAGARPNLLVEVDAATWAVKAEMGLPAEVVACRAGGGSRLNSGFEGLTIGADGEIWVAQQRGWSYDDAACTGLEDADGYTRLWIYDPDAESWDHVSYELEPIPATANWVGLSEITLLPDGSLALIERDNVTGDFSEIKSLIRIDADDLEDGVITREKQTYDVLPAMRATNGWIHDKLEGFAVTADGEAYVVTDNDGVDDSSGETQFLRLGPWEGLFD